MRKAFKKLLATLLALAMVCALAAPVFAADTTENLGTHSFKAYQIFTGTVSFKAGELDLRLSNANWGDGVNSKDLLAALAGATFKGTTFNTSMSPAKVVEEMAKLNTSDAITFARLAYANKTNATNKAIVSNKNISFTEDGYYLIVDTTQAPSSANNFSVLVLGKNGTSIPLKEKVVKPSVEKWVEESSGNWLKNADHAVNEKFKFKVVATLPESTTNAYDYYEEYQAVITDFLASVYSYDPNSFSVTLTSDNHSITVTKDTDYSFTEHSTNSGILGKSLEFSFADLKKISGLDLNKGATIEITYDAYLNDGAVYTTESHTITNARDNVSYVSLTYSHDPNEGTPTFTDKDYVYVLTYGVQNTKYKDTETAGNELKGAQFKLYTDNTYTNEVKLYKSSANSYHPVGTSGKQPAEYMESGDNGKFDIVGLDAGTYYLRETKAPDGYNTCEPIKIEINASFAKGEVYLTNAKGMVNKIVDYSGVVLPSTGGIGTTIFYVVGGLLMVGAAVLLVTKKRMQKN
mgnify:CR=1 FL=1